MRIVTILTPALAVLLATGCAPKSSPPPQQAATDQIKFATTQPKLVDFWATWCPPCKEMKPVIEELTKTYAGKIEIVSIDVDSNKLIAQKYNVQAIPTLVFMDAAGTERDRSVGLIPRDSIVSKFKALGFIQ